MRIVMVSNWLPPVRAGSSFYAGSLAEALLDRGHDVVVVTLDWGGDVPPPEGFRAPVVRLPVVRVPRLSCFYNLRLMGFAWTPRNLRRLKQVAVGHRAQILHHVNHIFDTAFLSASAGRAVGIPVVGSITTPIQHQSAWKQRLMTFADRHLVGRFGVRRWDGIVSLDQTVHEYVGQVYGPEAQRRSVVVPFGVRRELLEVYQSAELKRPGPPQVLMVGHIHPFRNPRVLVRAMPHVLRALPNARLVLAGRVDLPEPVEIARRLGLGPDRVQFLGETPHADVVRLMKESHVFASWVTGPFHSLGTAAMEAMLCGTPVINDIPEDLFGRGALKNGENIVLVDSLDERAVADALVRLLGDEDFRQRIAAGGRRFVREHLGWDRIAEQMEGFYERLLAGASRGGRPAPREVSATVH
jgi:glycosyltransferase involved in cell wall biosynthesis